MALKDNDIILSIDGKDIANNGTIQTQYGRLSFEYIYHTKQIGDSVMLDVLRDGKNIKIRYEIKREKELINYEYSKLPRYIIYGGLVFAPITTNYLYKISKFESEHLKKKLYNKRQTINYNEAITMIGTSFPHKVNRGYSNWASVLKSVNGIKIKNFKHLVNILDNIKSKYTKFEFLESAIIVLNTKEAKESFKSIKNIYRLNNIKNLK